MEIPFVGPSYDLLTRPSGVQRTINLVPVSQEIGNERVAWAFEDAAGLEAWSPVAAPSGSPWNSANEVEAGVWDFAEADFLATIILTV